MSVDLDRVLSRRPSPNSAPPVLVEPADPYPYMYASLPDEGALVMAVGTVGFNPVPEVPDTTPPVISSLTPATLTVDTPTTVTVTGTGFNASDKVYQDEGQMTTIFVSDTELTFQALASSAGIVDITVQGDGGTSPAIQMTVT